MRIIISPAKKMRIETNLLPWRDLPVFLEEAQQLADWLRSLSFAEAKALWGCNERLARENYERVQALKLRRELTPALLSYAGIQYQYMAPAVMEEGELAYLEEHLRILSGFYGVLRPMDGVRPYRLEMQAKARIPAPGGGEIAGLYEFWGDKIYREVSAGDGLILNLASKEYAKAVEPFLTEREHFVTCVFGELCEGKVVQKGTLAKMARGEMVRFLAQTRAESPEELKAFARLGYRFCAERSGEREYVFLREKEAERG